MRKRLKYRTHMIAGMLVVILSAGILSLWGLFIPNRYEWMTIGNTACIVDNTKISVGFYHYFYRSLTNASSLAALAAEYDSFDISTELSEQYYDEENGITWASYLQNAAMEQLAYIVFYSNCAQAQGLSLVKEQEQAIDAFFDNASQQAKEAGLSLNRYLSVVYGEYVGKATLREVLMRTYLAQNYFSYYHTQAQYTDEQFASFLKANRSTYYAVSFSYAALSFDEKNAATAVENAVIQLQQTVMTTENFEQTVIDALSGIDDLRYTFVQVDDAEAQSLADLPLQLNDWLFDASRQTGNTAVFMEAEQCLVVLFRNAELLRTDTCCVVREIFLPNDDAAQTKESTTDAESVVDGKAQNTALCDSILYRLHQSNQKEYLFSVFADCYEEEENPIYSGGLVVGLTAENVEGDLFNWLTDINRKTGDFEIYEDAQGISLIMYLRSEPNWKTVAREKMISQDFATLASDVQIIQTFGGRNILQEWQVTE